MARPLTIEDFRGDDGGEDSERRWVTLATARAFAAAMSVLAIATFVVNRSATALTVDGAVNAAEVASGTIELNDDDNGRSLFDLADMVPGRTSTQCITIRYDGSIVPVDLALQAEVEGDLGPYLDVVIDQGTTGSFEDCERFQSEQVVFAGTLARMAARDRIGLERFLNQGESRVYRFQFTLKDSNEALGRASTVGFIWEVKPT
ncbi:MAG: hypothetical protein OEZ14_02325 [Acidimicrobiia bacterium]|nr:hypothetical protein [Acidimicrobiia bacterium]MDH5519347.1 hypothetical protein [Acidimicrobiia bacterium]